MISEGVAVMRQQRPWLSYETVVAKQPGIDWQVLSWITSVLDISTATTGCSPRGPPRITPSC